VPKVSLNKITATLIVGRTDTLKATIAPIDATNQGVTWTSSDTSIATVDNSGKVIAVSAGVSTITVTTADGSKSATSIVTVSNPVVHPTAVSLNKLTDALTVGNTDNLTSTIAPNNATNQDVTWTSSDASIATVDTTGKVTAVSAGIATITVTSVDGSKIATCTVTVSGISDNTALTDLSCDNNQLTTPYSIKDTWATSDYRPQYTDSIHATTTDSLVITIKN